MGYSPGEFIEDDYGEVIHWEWRDKTIVLWNHNEMKIHLTLTVPEARRCVDQLMLLVNMAENAK